MSPAAYSAVLRGALAYLSDRTARLLELEPSTPVPQRLVVLADVVEAQEFVTRVLKRGAP